MLQNIILNQEEDDVADLAAAVADQAEHGSVSVSLEHS